MFQAEDPGRRLAPSEPESATETDNRSLGRATGSDPFEIDDNTAGSADVRIDLSRIEGKK